MFKEQDVDQKVDEVLQKMKEQLESELSIVVGGKVSSGKSSFLNALFCYNKLDSNKFEVGAEAGVTKELKDHVINEKVKVWDTPGLNDLDPENVKITTDFLKKGHDLSILVIAGAADSSQKENYDLLKKSTRNGTVIVVLNKSDQYSKADRQLVIKQWKEQLGLSESETIYPCVSLGYGENDITIDPYTDEEKEIPLDEYGIPKTVRDVDVVREEVRKKLENINKDLLFLHAQQSKDKAALMTISGACLSSGVGAFLPGAGATVTAIQIAAICSLHYIYKGEVLSKSQAIAILPAYAMQAIGRNLFLWAKSVLPPTGALDAAAAGIAVTLTTSMLITVNYMLKNGMNLSDMEETKETHSKFSSQLTSIMKDASRSDLGNSDFWTGVIKRFI